MSLRSAVRRQAGAGRVRGQPCVGRPAPGRTAGEQPGRSCAARERPAGARRASGFTLLEVTVALIIAALATAALLQAAGAGMSATTGAALYDQAIVRAKSHLAAADATQLRAGETQGDDGGGFHWVLRIVPVQTASVQSPGAAGPAPSRGVPVVLYRLVVGISWQQNAATRRVILQTERIGGA